MWEGSDVDFAVPMVVTTKELFPDFCAASFDRCFAQPRDRYGFTCLRMRLSGA